MLDLRVGDFGPEKGADRFIFVHDACLTNVSVRQGLTQARQFLENHPNEFIFLAFHRLLARHKGEFDFEGLANLVDDILNGAHGSF